jgi:thymidylate synthase (FAD)
MQNSTIVIAPYGFVELISVRGDDKFIADSARTSYSDSTKHKSTSDRLVRYLISHHHWTPVEMASVVLRIRAPLPIITQFLRHRSGNFNAESARYSEVKDEMWSPTADNPLRKQSRGQTSTRTEDISFTTQADYLWVGAKHHMDQLYEIYQNMLAAGIAKEQARFVLPQAMYSTMVMSFNIRSLLTMLNLRDDVHAQLEIQEYARAIDSLVRPHFAASFSAYDDYLHNAIVLSAMDQSADLDAMTASEREEFAKKVELMRAIVATADQKVGTPLG